ncbi:MAG: hypothetical protein KatS3mg007_2254 [Thermoanaerobaculum sp.]|nr:MAG: hypothetical protein KatS3mg007_2254 [Thermoanaerobaculum sp.]
MKKTSLFAGISALLLATAVAAAPPPSQAVEKVDLMRQITTQWVKPNVLIVLDRSGSMADDMWGNNVGVDNQGGPNKDGQPPTWTLSSTTSGCSGGKKKYTYTLSFYFPSRMAVMKNSLGNSVTIWQPPAIWKTAGFWPTISGWTKSTSFGTLNTIKYTSNTCLANSPALPTQLAAIQIPAAVPPQDLVGRSADKVNWGLLIYSSSLTNYHQVIQPVDPDDANQATAVQNIENALRLSSAGGLTAGGWTPTSRGLNAAKASLKQTWNNDLKKSCGRLYATILVTDGESNYCNPSNSVWGSGCPNYTTNWRKYPPGRADELFLKTADSSSGCTTTDTSPTNVQTFVIGVSPDVSRCELNLTAYFGRTDASAGTNVAQWWGSSRLPQNDSGSTSLSNYKPSEGDYAFFADNARSLRDAFAAIVAGLGVGDYATAAPSVASAAAVSSSVGFLASVSYPGFKGHLYAYDLAHPTAATGQDRFPLLWDAGAILASGNKGLARKIYTWDPRKIGKPGQNPVILIDDPTTDAPVLETLCTKSGLLPPCGITPNVVDFILGNDGTLTGTKRQWILGAIINSTPAVTGPPEAWKQTTSLLSQHQTFEKTYEKRHQLVWVGASDGMLHAFDMIDGAEILAIIPPELLAKQVELYNNYKANPSKSPMGQPMDPDLHIYGVANSPRFADVYFGTDGFKTVMYITEGPGGTGIHALDISHPYPGRTGVVAPDGLTYNFPADPNYDPDKPFEPLWGYTRDGAAYTATFSTNDDNNMRFGWAVPAVGMDDSGTFHLVLGQGYDPNRTDVSIPAPRLYRLNAATGQLLRTDTLLNQSSAWVRNHSFADNTIWQTNAKFYQPDNFVDEGLQGDLHGQLWRLPKSTSWVAERLLTITEGGRAAPLYFATSVAAYPVSNSPTHAIYAFSTGSFYEKSPYVNPPSPTFSSYLKAGVHVAVRALSSSTPSIKSFLLKDITKREGGKFGPRTQPTTTPLLLVPDAKHPNEKAIALFAVYDPDAGTCVGTSYVVRIDFDPKNVMGAAASTYTGGPGAASGFVLSERGVVFAKSFVGEGGRAHFDVPEPPIEIPPPIPENQTINFWRELQ